MERVLSGTVIMKFLKEIRGRWQFPLAVTAIVLVILSKKGRPLHGFAIAGLVMGIISILMSIFMTFYWGIVISTMNDPEFMSMYNEILEMYQ